ncbi:MarP family serine protease [Mycobacterium sp. CBMA293]|uniref:MarP family serine protease n=1 Tax=unclassified Mycolicibacterium TaxID=2636767 RepID=UPI0012DCE118|nr:MULTISPECIES: MarP family serine protease [unclassified Mycolicibacterium]MUL45164.1 MarP family serine protease [Mycolicibacterium sp. CBMA 360]MUL56682.1 MarP family serine protease [Mycolicibacterium sp. CBMA 335]MUL69721.1 MarP family serine protease [Mycolicibacterium sp. CBMA 311]MUL91769.1 MarP family serine protease [Mycolicibacterium sp. CBMA 230]MUM05508.1 serine protease [Mycolicibacterium sp. CBMA 213]
MARKRLVAVAPCVALAAALLAGCGTGDRSSNTATSAATPSATSTTIPSVAAPDPNVVHNAAVSAAQASVLKVHALAHSCKRQLDGTGFVAAPNRIVTTAHGVAGTDAVSVDVDGKKYDGQVVSFDPNLDIAILDVPNLPTHPLVIADAPAPTGADAATLGYALGGPYTAKAARVREVINLSGPDIYRTTTVTREVYALRAAVQHGDSGGPVVDANGHVIGVVFGAAQDDPDTGFALTAKQVAPALATMGNTQPVPTGQCVS